MGTPAKLLTMAFLTLASRDHGRLPLLLRLASIVLCVGSLISGCLSIGGSNLDYLGGSSLIVIPSSLIFGWDIIYLILLSMRIYILLPITITFDLIAWLFAGVWGTLFSIYNIPRLGRLLSTGDLCGLSAQECADNRRVVQATVATCVLLWTLT
jgi:hypothetical protein